MCLIALKEDFGALIYVPHKFCTKELYKSIANSKVCDGESSILDFIPEEEKTEELYLELVKKDILYFKHVPQNMLTERICLTALQQQPYMIIDIPEEKRTNDMYLELINSGTIICVPKEMLTEEICMEAVRKHGNELMYVPKEMLTEEMCIEAIKWNVGALEYVPKEMLTEKICMEAVKKKGYYILTHVPKEMLTEEMCMEAIKQDGYALEDVPKEMRTEKMYIEAVKQNINMLFTIEKDITPEMCVELLKIIPVEYFDWLPNELITEDGWNEAMKHKFPNISIEEIDTLFVILFPDKALQNEKIDKIIELSEAKLNITEENKIYIERIKNLIIKNKEYASLLTANFWNIFNVDRYIVDYLHNGNCDFEDYIKQLVEKAEKFIEINGMLPEIAIVSNWERPVEEYNDEEYRKLLSAGIIENSPNYRVEYHKEWILKMYQLFGYDTSIKVLEQIPDLSQENIEKIISVSGTEYGKLFETKYTLFGDMAKVVKIINLINDGMKKKDAFELFSEINSALLKEEKKVSITAKVQLVKTQGETEACRSLVDLFDMYHINLEQRTCELLENNVRRELNNEKLKKVSGILRHTVSETVDIQQGRIYDLIYKLIKDVLDNNQKIDKDEIIKKLKEELESKDENGDYLYSQPIRAQRLNIERTLEVFLGDKKVYEELTDNEIKLLLRAKNQIGQGWIRKLIGVPQKMNEDEFYKNCEKVGMKLEHEERVEPKNESRNEVLGFLGQLEHPEVITFETLEIMFGAIRSPYSKEFAKYFIENKDEIMNNPEYIHNFSKMHNRFSNIISNSNIVNAYRQGLLRVETVLKLVLNENFVHEEGEDELARIAVESQFCEDFSYAQALFKTVKDREETTIPPVGAKGRKFRGRMLRVDDPLSIFVGNITLCCQIFGDNGEGAMLHSTTEKNGGVFVIEEIDERGKAKSVVAQSWVWRNNDVMCFDNVEVKGDNLTVEEQEEILDIYKQAAEKAIILDKKTLSNMVASKEISQDVYDGYVLKEVRMGLGYAEGIPLLKEKISKGELKKATDIVKPKEADKVYSMGLENKTPWIDSNSSVIIAENEANKRVGMHSYEGEEPVTYRMQREEIEQEGIGIERDTVREIRKIETKSFSQGRQTLQKHECIEDIADMYDCSTENIRVNISRDRDWYAVSYELDDRICMANISLVNGLNANKTTSTRKSDIISAGFELAKVVYERFLEAAEKGKKVECDLLKDTSGINIETMIKKGLVELDCEEGIKRMDGSSIEVRKITLIPNLEKITRELELLEKYIERASERKRVHSKYVCVGDDRA